MKHTKTPTPETQAEHPRDTAVDAVFDQLILKGAEQVHSEFTIALPGQHDLVFEGKRLLIVDPATVSESYNAYVEAAGLYASGVAYTPVNDEATVMLFELPRDGRTLLQVATSTGNARISNAPVYGTFGKALQQLGRKTGQTLDAKSFDLHSALYLRLDDSIALNPATTFTADSPAARERLFRSVYDQLTPRYDNHGAAAMMNAFLEAQA